MQGLLQGIREISPTDPLALAGASAIPVAAAVHASRLPARRASTVDPMYVLRAE